MSSRQTSLLLWNENTTDLILVKALWVTYFTVVPLIGLASAFTVGLPGPYWMWTIATLLVMLIPTLFYWRGWLPGSVKYLGPMAIEAALIIMSFTIHQSTTSWTIWLLPSIAAALYFNPRPVWLANVVSWVGISAAIAIVPHTFPEVDITSLIYYALTIVPCQVIIARTAHKAGALLQKAETESAGREAATGNLGAALAGIQEAAGRLVAAAGELEGETGAARTFLQGDFAQKVVGLVAASRSQQAKVAQAGSVMGELSRSITGIASGAQTNAAAVQRGTGLINRMAGATENVSTATGNVLAASVRSAEVAREGSEAAAQMAQGIDRIRASASDAAVAIAGLRDLSGRIGGIADTIKGIAGQTNLLALNAAIEAARVGEHGRGFAVVAQEVRQLSERSAHEANNIAETLTAIRTSIEQATTAMNDAIGEVEAGDSVATTAKRSLAQVMETTQSVARQMEAIAGETRNLSDSARELVKSFDAIDQVAAENGAASEEMSAATDDVVSMVQGIGKVSAGNLAAAEEMDRGAERLREALNRVAGVSANLSGLATKLEALLQAGAVR